MTNQNPEPRLRAGTAIRRITPPISGAMGGFGFRKHGSEGIRDDLYVRCLWLEHNDQRLLIIAFDLAAVSCNTVREWKEEISLLYGLKPNEVLINLSHTHSGPLVIERFYNTNMDVAYMSLLRSRLLEAVAEASYLEDGCSMAYGRREIQFGICRRRPDGQGGVKWAPYPDGYVDRDLPVLQVSDRLGNPLCVLFCAAAHPSLYADYLISADYPGVACRLVEQALGGRVMSIFLQGSAGDTKVNVNVDMTNGTWTRASSLTVQRAGRILADGVLQVLSEDMRPVYPSLSCNLAMVQLPVALPDDAQAYYAKMRISGIGHSQVWADYHMARLRRGEHIANTIACPLHGIRLAADIYILAVGGELTGGLAQVLRRGLQLPDLIMLGYSNGAVGYLPNAAMLAEGGYEPERSVYQGTVLPAPFTPEIDEVLLNASKTILH